MTEQELQKQIELIEFEERIKADSKRYVLGESIKYIANKIGLLIGLWFLSFAVIMIVLKIMAFKTAMGI